jgi:hypothetical protein
VAQCCDDLLEGLRQATGEVGQLAEGAVGVARVLPARPPRFEPSEAAVVEVAHGLAGDVERLGRCAVVFDVLAVAGPAFLLILGWWLRV